MAGRTLTEHDRAAISRVFEDHQTYITSIARQCAFQQDDVPDIVQRVALRLCRSLNTFRGDAQIRTWLYRIVRNEANSHYQREMTQIRARDALTVTPPPDVSVHPEDGLRLTERYEALHEAMGHLTETQQDAVRNEIEGVTVSREEANSTRAARWRAMHALRIWLTTDVRFAGDGDPAHAFRAGQELRDDAGRSGGYAGSGAGPGDAAGPIAGRRRYRS
jgi:RNA polymerase sigma factor (sigma-70 family)